VFLGPDLTSHAAVKNCREDAEFDYSYYMAMGHFKCPVPDVWNGAAYRLSCDCLLQKLPGFRAGPVLKHGFSAFGAFENAGSFYRRLVAKIFTVCAACRGALHVSDDVKIDRVVLLFNAHEFYLRVAGRVGQVAQELGDECIARRDAVEVGPLVVEFQGSDAHAGGQFGIQ